MNFNPRAFNLPLFKASKKQLGNTLACFDAQNQPKLRRSAWHVKCAKDMADKPKPVAAHAAACFRNSHFFQIKCLPEVRLAAADKPWHLPPNRYNVPNGPFKNLGIIAWNKQTAKKKDEIISDTSLHDVGSSYIKQDNTTKRYKILGAERDLVIDHKTRHTFGEKLKYMNFIDGYNPKTLKIIPRNRESEYNQTVRSLSVKEMDMVRASLAPRKHIMRRNEFSKLRSVIKSMFKEQKIKKPDSKSKTISKNPNSLNYKKQLVDKPVSNFEPGPGRYDPVHRRCPCPRNQESIHKKYQNALRKTFETLLRVSKEEREVKLQPFCSAKLPVPFDSRKVHIKYNTEVKIKRYSTRYKKNIGFMSNRPRFEGEESPLIVRHAIIKSIVVNPKLNKPIFTRDPSLIEAKLYDIPQRFQHLGETKSKSKMVFKFLHLPMEYVEKRNTIIQQLNGQRHDFPYYFGDNIKPEQFYNKNYTE